MIKHLNLATIAAALVAAFSFTPQASAGSPGFAIASAAITEEGEIATDFATDADAIADITIAKLNLLAKNPNTTDEKLTLEANKGRDKIERAAIKATAKANVAARKAFVRLANLDEGSMITQITDVDTARDDALDDIDGAAATTSGAIADALDAILNPAP